MITIPSESPGTETPLQINRPFIWGVSVVAAMGGLLFGYDWVVIGGAKPFFEPYFQLASDDLKGWANSCALIGCLFGSLLSGRLSDILGRKSLLIAAALLFAVSSVLTGWAQGFSAFVVWRIAGGVAIGMASNLSPLYIAEIAPSSMRGCLVSINQLTIVIGIVLAQMANLLIAEKVPDNATAEFIHQSWNGQYGWRWMFTAVAIPSIVFLLGSILVPESPRWLIKIGMREKARAILTRIGGDTYAENEIRDVEASLELGQTRQAGLRDLLEPKLLRVLLIGCSLSVLQQWSGINVIFNYAEDIFKAAGYGISAILFNIVISGVVMLVFTLIAVGTVDRFGRRALMLIGCGGIGVFHACIALAYCFHLKGLPVVIPVLAAIGCYSFSLAPITWVLISEIFPNRIRGTAISVAVSALWIACFILTYTFPLLNSALGPANTFWLYCAICFAGFIFIHRWVPETKGKSLEQIERELTT